MKSKIWILLFSFFYATCLLARTMDFGYLDIEINKETGTIKTLFNFNPTQLGNPALLFHNTLGRSFWRAGAQRCQWRNIETQIHSDEEAIVSATAVCPAMNADLFLDLTLLDRAPGHYKILTRINNQGIESTMLASKSKRDIRIAPLVDRSLGHYISIGMAHIGAIPEQWVVNGGEKHPYRLDHILFIVALLITGGSLMQTFKSASGFALGHTITLMIGTFGALSLPQHLIDFSLLLSILIVALQGILQKRSEHRFLLGFAPGLIHGFAFAATLRKLELTKDAMASAFAGIDLGLLLGQMLIIALALPLILMIKRYSNYYPQLLRSSALGVFLISCYWLIERAVV